MASWASVHWDFAPLHTIRRAQRFTCRDRRNFRDCLSNHFDDRRMGIQNLGDSTAVCQRDRFALWSLDNRGVSALGSYLLS
jgi:hypothetical protein